MLHPRDRPISLPLNPLNWGLIEGDKGKKSGRTAELGGGAMVVGGRFTLLDWYQTVHTVSDPNRVTLLICHLNKLSRVVMHQQYCWPPGGGGEEEQRWRNGGGGR